MVPIGDQKALSLAVTSILEHEDKLRFLSKEALQTAQAMKMDGRMRSRNFFVRLAKLN